MTHDRSEASRIRGAVIEALLGSVLTCGLAFLLQWRYGFNWADEGLLWYASQRTALGELPILDFFSYDPGRYYWNSLFFHLLGDSGLFTMLLACAAFGTMGLAVVWFAMCRAGLPFAWRFGCAVLLTVGLGYPRHKVFEQSLSLMLCGLVFWLLSRPDSVRRWLGFGLITGIAAIFGRNHGVFYVFAAFLCGGYLFISRRRKLLPKASVFFGTGVVIGYSPLLVLMLLNTDFRRAFTDSVLFTANWQLPLPIPFLWRVGFTAEFGINMLQSIAVGIACVLIPLTYISGFVLFLWRGRREQGKSKPVTLLLGAACIAGLPYLQQGFDRADFGHIAQATLPFILAFVALAYYGDGFSRTRVIARCLFAFSVALVLACWLPSEPGVRFLRMRLANADSVSQITIGNRKFEVERPTVEVLSALRSVVEKCAVAPDEFMAAPHFPGVYAFLGARAPFWEMYYLYSRPADFQRRHIAAIARTRLILLAPEATVDGLERLKLKSTYGLLLEYIEQHYREVQIPGVIGGAKIYLLPGACPAVENLGSGH
ncbi:hypothetical protein J2T41_005949 [Pseudomonas citronellolis]|uniref:hypothetical protein n=1 Tax=Pseudomonas citronellolis TaxID=53408 RepID=UPI00209D4449|nr:hypothetical protein [Pseudomonas citronellolis]MCP1646294.1 hypothetical protein [Pseudomonas citronellolis]MCP1669214.1 hypothetical protein [Pseudomonas citronellolis]MCP1700884.1 hypothetical protein [Pseudomonas citronellolis]MCP1707080.1 hypothetical protein [Pseudomonas citronellolis]MCP1800925.1 hypothetical protein [Pseudomonas citronellolis]